jgi:hypothetical protein
MPRTLESIVDNHRVAAARRAAGKPVWEKRVDIKSIIDRDIDNTSEENAAAVANEIARLLRSKLGDYLEGEKLDFELLEIVEGMEALRPDSYADDPSFTALEDLNNMLDGLYDWADTNRVWMG